MKGIKMTFEEKFIKAYEFLKTTMREAPSFDDVLHYLYAERDIGK